MKTVVIVGVGALGSHVVLFARNWKAHIRIVDCDRVEAKNVQSQFHSEMGKGKQKAKALEAAMQGLFHRPIEPFPVKLGRDNAAQLLCYADLVIDCTDNFETRAGLQIFCRNLHPLLHGCLSAAGDVARVIWSENFTPDPEGELGQATCEGGENLWFHGMAGAVLAGVAQKFLETGKKQSFQVTPTSFIRLT
jgi:molybdopterin-synthase adenylyltransferase